MDSAWKAGSLFGAAAVGLGAFGAHALKSYLKADPESVRKLSAWDTAVKYQFVHALALLVYSCKIGASKTPSSSSSHAPAALFTWGVILFSGSIYVLTLLPARSTILRRVLGPITPIGGLLLIGGWVGLFWA